MEPEKRPKLPNWVCDQKMTVEAYLEAEHVEGNAFGVLTGCKAFTETSVAANWYQMGATDWNTVERVVDFFDAVEAQLILKLDPEECAVYLFFPRGYKDHNTLKKFEIY